MPTANLVQNEDVPVIKALECINDELRPGFQLDDVIIITILVNCEIFPN